jgi:hypothetical protein
VITLHFILLSVDTATRKLKLDAALQSQSEAMLIQPFVMSALITNKKWRSMKTGCVCLKKITLGLHPLDGGKYKKAVDIGKQYAIFT